MVYADRYLTGSTAAKTFIGLAVVPMFGQPRRTR